MQHLDEGTIHSWLDGALSTEEATRVSAHVEECPQCAAAIAEARGFIAASSRILTALDNVPRAVVPISARAKPKNWAAWRAAAAVLVVALGSFAVLRERMGTRSSSAEIVPFAARTTEASGVADRVSTDSVQRESSPSTQAPTTSKVLANPAAPTRVPSPLGAAKMGNREPSRQDGVSTLAATPGSSVPLSIPPPVAAGNNPISQSGGAVKGSVQGERVSGVMASPRPSSAAMSDASAGSVSIRVVGVSVAKGEVRISYEVAPGDTVVLAEVPSMTLNSVVVTGAGTTTARTADTSGTRIQIRGATAPQSVDTAVSPRIVLRGATTMSAIVPDTQNRKTSFGAQAAAARPPVAQTLNGVTTLTWIDPASGSMKRLSGRHTAVELLEIKRGIEQLHAAEAAAKKNP